MVRWLVSNPFDFIYFHRRYSVKYLPDNKQENALVNQCVFAQSESKSEQIQVNVSVRCLKYFSQ